MRRLKNTWTKANITDKIHITIFTLIIGLLTSVVFQWIQSGFYTDYGF